MAWNRLRKHQKQKWTSIIHQQYCRGQCHISSAFPSICYLLKLFVLVPMSEAVVERGFSKMKLTLTDKPTRLDNKV